MAKDAMKPDDEVSVALGEYKGLEISKIIVDELIECKICSCSLLKDSLLTHWQQDCVLKEKP